MNEKSWLRVMQSSFGNRQSKIGNRKLAGVVAIVLALALVGARIEAQQPSKIPRIGFVVASSASTYVDRVAAFRQQLRDVGYVESKNIAIEYRFSEGINDRLASLALELVRLKVDVIIAGGGTPAILAAKNATTTIPIIFVGSNDPVATGLVASLAHPGGNITGLTIGGPELYGKRVELLKEVIPKVSRVGMLRNPKNPVSPLVLKETQAVAHALGLQLQSLEVRSPEDIETAFEAATRAQAGALIVTQDPPIMAHRKQVVDLAAKGRLPAMYPETEWANSGGLMSYGVNVADLFRRAAVLVDKILKGAKPADLPVEQPMKFEFEINLKTAKALNLTIPQSVLFRADKVIR